MTLDSHATPNLIATHPTLSPLAQAAPRWEGSGTVVAGRYTLLECVGEGGMGAVWSAQQTAPVRRLVAVKLLHGRGDSRNVLARFEAERQALAVMDHPNVAKILDGGVTEAGSPYFVMEYVQGVAVTKFCDARRLTPAQRLELFVPVCEAIHHAHQKGIIHRDVKPSNVLVALDGDRAVPKVIDFGVAKATGAPLTDRTLNTGFGVVVGTPQYMSPEQAGLGGSDIDTRSDVYSLGVLLYELLTGGPPFAQRDDSREGVFEILRLIREEDAARPSTRLNTSDALPLLGERRGTDPAKLAGLLRSELDWVVMKALEKDRTRRYDTAAALAADVRRYLAGEAVLAHPPSLRYRVGKALRKNRVPAVAAAAFVLTHVAGLTSVTAALVRTDAAREAEAEQRVVAEAARSAEAELRVAAEAGRVRAEAAEALAESRRKAAVAAQQRTMATLRAATGEDVERLIGARAELGPHERAYLQAIIQRWQGFARSGGDTPEARAVAGEGAIHVANLRRKLGDQAAAVAGFREAVAVYGGLARDFPEVPEYRRELAVAHTLLGNLLRARGEADQAAAEHRRAVEVLERHAADAPAAPEYRRLLAACQSNLGVSLRDLGQVAESEARFRRALAVTGDLLRESPSPTRQEREAVAVDRAHLGGALRARGQVAEAAASYRLAVEDQVRLAAEFPDVRKYRLELSASRNSLGHLLQAQGDLPAAEGQFRLAVETQAKLTADYPAVPKYRVSLGRACSSLGNLLGDAAKWAEALACHDRAVAALTVAAAAQAGDVITLGLLRDAHLGRATSLAGAGRPADAAKDRARAAELAAPAGRRSPTPELAPPPRVAPRRRATAPCTRLTPAETSAMSDRLDEPDWDRTAGVAAPDLDVTRNTRSPMVGVAPLPRWDVAGALVAGRYRLIECVGEGGMGAVWSAQQTAPVRRLVAVKLVKAGADSKGVLARFDAERQALAVMDHPNVAKILDGGVSDAGSPYFVMEYVKGVTITRFCDQRKFTARQRLELFVPVCEAIQHAHLKGIIHRDIKPSNVLVALANDRPVPKVIDFGVAKATGPALTDLTLNTEFGVVVGTPQYMSPEQASLTGFDIDTRSDVYSLGVLLYELLTGGPPFRQKGAERDSLLEILRLIREEEPTRPSTRLSQADALPLLSERRGTDPAKLLGLLRSELDWVVMKALEKDRTRRYETPAAFAADVRRYLAGEAVLAHPPSLRYRVGKALRKNRVPALAAAAVLLALVAGLAGTTAGLVRAEAAREAEAEQRVVAEAARAAEGELRQLADARLAVSQAAEALAEQRRQAAGVAEQRAMDVLRAATGQDVEKLIGSRKDLGPNERAYLEAIAGRWEEFARTTVGTPEAGMIAAEGASRVAHLRMMLGEDDAAIAGFRAVAARLEKLSADAPADAGYRNRLALTRANLGKVLCDQGRVTEGEAEERRGLALRVALVADFPDHARYRDDLASSRLNLGTLLARGHRLAEAEVELRAARALYVAALADPAAAADGRAGLAKSRNSMAVVLAETGRHAEAEAEYRLSIDARQKLAAEFPDASDFAYDYAGTRQNLGNLLLGAGRVPEAEREFRGALATTEKLVADFPGTPRYRVSLGGSHCNFANLLKETGRPAEAVPHGDKAVAALTAVLAKNPNDATGRLFLRNSYLCRALALAATGRHAEAEADFDRAITYSPPGDHPEFRQRQAASRPKPEVAPPPRAAK